jgi:hypothetical protein
MNRRKTNWLEFYQGNIFHFVLITFSHVQVTLRNSRIWRRMKKERRGTNVYEGERNQEFLFKYQPFSTRKREVNFRSQFLSRIILRYWPWLFQTIGQGQFMKSKGEKHELLITFWLSVHTLECRIALSNTYRNKVERQDTCKAKNRRGRPNDVAVTKTIWYLSSHCRTMMMLYWKELMLLRHVGNKK